ncbi:hypothetical protein V1509DRAFT_563639 [Lipomyces kononenkoae]
MAETVTSVVTEVVVPASLSMLVPRSDASPAKPSVIYDSERLKPPATNASDDLDIELLANAFQSHLSFNKSRADSSPSSLDLQSTSTLSSPSSTYATPTSRQRSSSRVPLNMGFTDSFPSANPFSLAGAFKKINMPSLARARKVSLAEFPKQHVFFEFRTWSDESSSEDEDEDNDFETRLENDNIHPGGQVECDGEAGDEKRSRISDGQWPGLLRRKKKKSLEPNTQKARREVLVNTPSSAKPMTTIMSASLDGPESCDSREKEQLLDNIETLTRELSETRARYDELNSRYKTVAARLDEGRRRENELLRSRLFNYHESKIVSQPPAAPPTQPKPVGSDSKGFPNPVSSGAAPTKAGPNPPSTSGVTNLPHMTEPESKVYERCGAIACSLNRAKKGLAMGPRPGAVNIPNLLEKTLDRPKYRFEPNSVTIVLCSYVQWHLHFCVQ